MHAPLNIGIVSFAHGHVGAYARRIAGFDDARLHHLCNRHTLLNISGR